MTGGAQIACLCCPVPAAAACLLAIFEGGVVFLWIHRRRRGGGGDTGDKTHPRPRPPPPHTHSLASLSHLFYDHIAMRLPAEMPAWPGLWLCSQPF